MAQVLAAGVRVKIISGGARPVVEPVVGALKQRARVRGRGAEDAG
jgi:hypothetical protein